MDPVEKKFVGLAKGNLLILMQIRKKVKEKLCALWKRSKLGQFSYKIAYIKAYFEKKVLNYTCNKINLRMAEILSDFCRRRVIY